jgi:hypothetical protein
MFQTAGRGFCGSSDTAPQQPRSLIMAHGSESPLDRLWAEYSTVFRDFDDLTLARWLAQTLAQLHGRAWRFSHPLLGCYRLAAQTAHNRQIWLKRLATPPAGFADAECCRSPLLPLFTRDILESGLICVHCSGTAVPFADLPEDLQPLIRQWADQYAPVHAVAHQEDQESEAYETAFEEAATKAESLLAFAATRLIPSLVDVYGATVWEDQDECLEVRPEDVPTTVEME